MMKTTIAKLFIACLFVGPVDGASLRKVKGGWELQADISEARELQVGSGFNNTDTPTGLSDDATLINEIIQLFLPLFNAAFQAVVPDPLDLPFLGEYKLPEFDFLGCTVNAAFDFELGDLIGLSGVSIDRLLIQRGTENVDAGCFETLFNAIFDLSISSINKFGVQGLAGGLTADACGFSFDDEVTGGVDTFEPSFRGVVSISGLLLGDLATITFAETANVFDIGYESVEAYVDDVPLSWNLVIGDISRKLGDAMKSELSSTVEPTLNLKSTESMEGQSMVLSNELAWRYRTGFMRNRVRRQVSQAYQSTANFFGNAFSFLGFGGSENGDE